MHRPLVILGLGLVAVALLIMAGATVWYERPTQLTVAISSSDSDDYALIGATEKLLKRGRDAVRIRSNRSTVPQQLRRRSTMAKPIWR